MIRDLLLETTYLELYLLTFGYFLILYFGVGYLFSLTIQGLLKNGRVSKIVDGKVLPSQTKFEILHSLSSIFVFGFSSIPIVALVKSGSIELPQDTVLNVLLGVLALNLWNEVYFFLIHRLLHIPFFMRKIHYVHHRSLVPTLYSVYSFHWIEALLLSCVPFLFILVMPLSPVTLLLYPFTSILINFSGHCNVRFGDGTGSIFKLFGTIHNSHHSKGLRHYGFATPFMDWIHQRFNKQP